MLATVALVALTFVVGFAMKRGGLCTYAAVIQVVHHERAERFVTFLGAAAWSALISIPLFWLHPAWVRLPGLHDHVIAAISGGLIFGLGAFLNRGCIFGTFVQLTGGNLTYLATLAGMAGGVVGTHQFFDHAIPQTSGNPVIATPNLTAMLWLMIALAFAVFRLLHITLPGSGFGGTIRALCFRRWQASLTMLVIGLGGGLLFLSIDGWSYSSALSRTSLHLFNEQIPGPSLLTLSSAAAMIAGGITAAMAEGSFDLNLPQLRPFIGCLVGGALMGSAATLIPGGNDNQLLSGIPSLAPHAITAYILMVAFMLILVQRLHRPSKS